MTFKLSHGTGHRYLYHCFRQTMNTVWMTCLRTDWLPVIPLLPRAQNGLFSFTFKHMQCKRGKGMIEAENSQGSKLYQLFSESHIIIMTSILENLGKWWLAVYSISQVGATLGCYFKVKARVKRI